jgi:hypothetical protein
MKAKKTGEKPHIRAISKQKEEMNHQILSKSQNRTLTSWHNLNSNQSNCSLDLAALSG